MFPIPFTRALIALFAGFAALSGQTASAQWAVIDPTNLIQNTYTAARALEQVNNQVRQIANQVESLRNEALNLKALGRSVAPDLLHRLAEMEALLDEARGIALKVSATEEALSELYSGDYAGTDTASRALAAQRQLVAAREALRNSLLLQAQTVEHVRADTAVLGELANISAAAPGALSAQQATNELLVFQAEQSMRLQALLAATTRADALRQAREMEALAGARAQHQHFFSGASRAHPETPPWN